ncbi:TetR/AcrR family transcriptional regulator [Asticcacaulis sp. W401b]|uniref:TetR/AcrR family transcriptional regulator n=1 Tax=Asticcacaulis sp. W401b TaxID=3388666 RepID=UPI0039710C84
MGLREAKKEKTRTRLLEAALHLVSENGFEATTISDIASAVEISPRTVLRYFPTKEDILVSWVGDRMASITTELERNLRSTAPAAALLMAGRSMLAAYDQNPALFLKAERLLLTSPSLAASKEQMIVNLGRDVAMQLTSIGEPKLSPLIAEALAGVVFAIMRATIVNWVENLGQGVIVEQYDSATSVISLLKNDTD